MYRDLLPLRKRLYANNLNEDGQIKPALTIFFALSAISKFPLLFLVKYSAPRLLILPSMALPFFYQALEIRLSMMVFIVASAWAASLLFVSLLSYAIDRSKKFNAALLLCQAFHCAAAVLFFFCPSDYSKSQTLVWFICTYMAATISGLLR